MIRPLVMVSSVIGGFEDVRATAAQAIEAGGAQPLLVNEDHPASGASSRNVCLDAVASSDAYLVIIGVRGGFIAPSGFPVVREEFHEARRTNKPVYAFIQSGERDQDAAAIVGEVEDYVSGVFRKEFSDLEELARGISASIRDLVQRTKIPTFTSASVIEEVKHKVDLREPYTRVVVSPVRREELIDPRDFQRKGITRTLLSLAHQGTPPLLSYSDQTSETHVRDRLIITSANSSRRQESVAQISVSQDGKVIVDVSIPAPWSDEEHGAGWSPVVAEEHIKANLAKSYAFASEVLNLIDPYMRNQSVLTTVALFGLGHLQIEANPKPRNSYTLNSWNDRADVLLAYDSAREISRTNLSDHEDEVDRAMFLLKRLATNSD